MPFQLPNSVRGVLWMAAAALFFSILITMIRELTQTLPVVEVVLFRAVFGIAFLAPWMIRFGIRQLKTQRIGMFILRMLLLLVAQATWYVGISRLPLADANALHFTLPLFGVILAVLFLGERAGMHRWTATIVGFIGALIIIRPGFVDTDWAMIAVLVSAAAYAASNTASKSLLKTESIYPVLFYSYFLMLPLVVVPAGIYWQTPAVSDIPVLLVFGIAGSLGQWCSTRAFQLADASLTILADYLRLPFTAAVGFYFYMETPSKWVWIGAAIIALSTWYVGHREILIAKRRKESGLE